jgi:hypothetical protein
MKLIRLALAFLLLALPACSDRADVVVVDTRPGVTRAAYLAMPAGERLESAKDVPSAVGRGVDVEVVVKRDGQKDVAVPLWYALHDARDSAAVLHRKVTVQPDSSEWSRRGHLWLPVPAAGTYYVQLVLSDSLGKPVGPRTEDFTMQ